MVSLPLLLMHIIRSEYTVMLPRICTRATLFVSIHVSVCFSETL